MAKKSDIPRLKTKPQYKDAPRYDLIYKYEGEFKKNYQKMSRVMLTEISALLIKFVKE